MSFGALGFSLPPNLNNGGGIYTNNSGVNNSDVAGGSWLAKILNTVVKVSDINANKRIEQARANPTSAGYYIDETALGINNAANVPTTQGAQAGAAVGSFADKAVNFVKQNWLIVGGVVGAAALYKMQPRSARNGVRRRNGATRRRRTR